jgi:urease accessory protein
VPFSAAEGSPGWGDGAPRYGTSSPSPLVGEGRGGGSGGRGTGLPHRTPPTPDPSPQGGGEQTIARATFAANRAHGRVALTLAATPRGTRRRDVREEGSLRVRFPGACAGAPEAVLVNTAGGIAGGDRFAVDLDLGDDAQLVVTTAAAEKIYRSLGPDARIDVTAKLADGAALTWLPQETILFDRARLARTVDIGLAPTATLVFAEMAVFGRTAMGEAVQEGSFSDRWQVRRGGRLIFAENFRLDGPIADLLGEAAVANGRAAVGTVLMVPGDDTAVAAVRAATNRFRGEVGISCWGTSNSGGLALARLTAPDGAALRHDLVVVLSALSRGALPRLWINDSSRQPNAIPPCT